MEGKFLLTGSLGLRQRQMVLASGISGGISLAVESDPRLVQEANRERVVDFTVTTLPEAIRILKNQIRKKEPAAVCVQGDRDAVLEEAVERGLQPDIVVLSNGSEGSSRMAVFLARGARAVAAPQQKPAEPPDGWLDVTWTVSEAPAKWLPVLDRQILKLVRDDDFRSLWARNSPLYLDRPLRTMRFLRLRQDELEQFTSAIAREVPAASVAVHKSTSNDY